MKFARSSGIWCDVTWQASTAAEAEDIRAVMGQQAKRIHVASDLSTPAPTELAAPRPRASDAPLRVVYLSRLTPKKNHRFALNVLERVRAPVHLSIVGPEEDPRYVIKCRRLAAGLPKNVSVSWSGAVRHECIAEIFANYDLMFLPTMGENFGHVIAEAFSTGLPVLLSNTTPWRDLAEYRICYDLSLNDMRAFRAAIEKEAARSPEEALARRKKVLDYAKAQEANSGGVDVNRELFRSVGSPVAQIRSGPGLSHPI